ncbi:SusC/RagA family TonB-linked outer membrane protein [Sphingobacterium corticis]|uniref:SusC/RagA family TonB-linked outer membrane protein n=1 Tax=Sphingobacterium corticis TaxID=1812823 RepID=A0ABW5NJH6_9SPHI
MIFCLFLYGNALYAQQKELTGKVTNAANEPLVGASVSIENGGATSTNSNGQFSINYTSGNRLRISMIGYATQTISLVAQTTVNIKLESGDQEIGEVVVTALGISREKKALGYAIQEIKSEELTKTNQQNVLNSMSGKISGMQVTAASGAVGAGSRVVLRGNNSFGNNQPLFVVDGVPVSNFSTDVGSGGSVDYGSGIGDIDPSNIESISVLKGANAAALYGQLAGNGVIIITTKNGKGATTPVISYNGGISAENPYILPKYQNSYGQGKYGEEYLWNLYREGNLQLSDIGYSNNLNPTTYQEWAEMIGFKYVDGLGSGINDNVDESWGPRLDAGLLLPQYSSPLDAQGNRTPTPWISYPNNVRDFFQTGHTMDHSLSLSSAVGKGHARLSLSTQNQAGTVPNTDQDRYTLSLNTSQQLTDRLEVNASMNYVRLENDNLIGQGYNSFNPMQSIGGWFGRQVDLNGLRDMRDAEFENGFPYNWNSNYSDNPFFTTFNNLNSRDKDRMFGNVSATYTVHPWLKVMGRVGNDWSYEKRMQITQNKSNSTLTSAANRTWGGGKFRQTSIGLNELNADLILSGQGNITPDLNLSYIAGANYRDYKYAYDLLGADQLTVPNLYRIGNAKGSPVTGMSTQHLRSNSVFAQASLGYKDALYLDLTARNDWNSTLPANNLSYFFPSASLSWVFTNSLPINEGILSFGKLRASWASVGKGAGNAYYTQGTYVPNTAAFNGVTLYSISPILPPLNLLPEKAQSTEVGAELRFLNNRIGLDFTYYNKKSLDQIMQVNVSGSTGFRSLRLNAGEIQNTGVEAQLNLGIIRKQEGFRWDMDINWAKNNSRVNSLYTDPTTGQDLESFNVTSAWSMTIDAIPGRPYGVMRGTAFQRDDSGAILVGSDGLPRYTGSPVELGNITPDWVGGINNRFSYKDFRLSFLIDMRKGGDVFSVTQWFGLQSGVLEETVSNGIRETGIVLGQNYMANERFVLEDDSANDIRVGARDYFQSLWGGRETGIIDGSFVKLREIQFGYDFPQRLFTNWKVIKRAGVSVFAHNVALLYTHKSNFAHIDPETGFGVGNDGLGIEQYQIPSNRSIGMKLNLTF